jgi:hypothetical protein
MKSTGENRQLGEKPVPVPLCPPQISHGLDLCILHSSEVLFLTLREEHMVMLFEVMVHNKKIEWLAHLRYG